MRARIEQARLAIPGATLEAGDASSLPLADTSIDLAFQFTAFSSVLDDGMKHAMAAEMLRVVRPEAQCSGTTCVSAIRRIRRVRHIGLNEVRRLFPGLPLDVERVTLAPPLARADRSVFMDRWPRRWNEFRRCVGTIWR